MTTDEFLIREFASAPESSIYHYTASSTLLSLLNNEHGELWLSNINYLNDSEELNWAKKLMKDSLVSNRHTMNKFEYQIMSDFINVMSMEFDTNSDLYIMSFSEVKDSLNQWRSYTPHSKGVCLEFNFENFNDLGGRGVQLVRCKYGKDEQIELVKSYLKFVFNRLKQEEKEIPSSGKILDFIDDDIALRMQVNSLISTGLRVCAIIKHPAFHEEREWCLIASFSDISKREVHYREGSSMFIPFVKLGVDIESNLKSVLLGPTPHSAMSAKSVGGFLRSKGFQSISVEVSEIPYREWS